MEGRPGLSALRDEHALVCDMWALVVELAHAAVELVLVPAERGAADHGAE